MRKEPILSINKKKTILNKQKKQKEIKRKRL